MGAMGGSEVVPSDPGDGWGGGERDSETFLPHLQKALVLDQDCAVLADQEVRLENRITFE